jgi:hypothetical protein
MRKANGIVTLNEGDASGGGELLVPEPQDHFSQLGDGSINGDGDVPGQQLRRRGVKPGEQFVAIDVMAFF